MAAPQKLNKVNIAFELYMNLKPVEEHKSFDEFAMCLTSKDGYRFVSHTKNQGLAACVSDSEESEANKADKANDPYAKAWIMTQRAETMTHGRWPVQFESPLLEYNLDGKSGGDDWRKVVTSYFSQIMNSKSFHAEFEAWLVPVSPLEGWNCESFKAFCLTLVHFDEQLLYLKHTVGLEESDRMKLFEDIRKATIMSDIGDMMNKRTSGSWMYTGVNRHARNSLGVLQLTKYDTSTGELVDWTELLSRLVEASAGVTAEELVRKYPRNGTGLLRFIQENTKGVDPEWLMTVPVQVIPGEE
ncbi:uncharacterized protein BO80DRAFT_473690 [Aspergillus ibericus CBS 121593]|uniref:Uncharacterized protein n=1 Tax=Aspergillus ibericus CBS 121593 TaxID=1448316 RepID=A0A395H3L3_9EURO|nr:hypothetical protein BO80DRAFT_473690 [Aspergillus ibericus CBS 121593]RAL01448.1 hypothetical protein BO80DRAFT_473690 [Aspergillus ibericus CBS 121593]